MFVADHWRRNPLKSGDFLSLFLSHAPDRLGHSMRRCQKLSGCGANEETPMKSGKHLRNRKRRLEAAETLNLETAFKETIRSRAKQIYDQNIHKLTLHTEKPLPSSAYRTRETSDFEAVAGRSSGALIVYLFGNFKVAKDAHIYREDCFWHWQTGDCHFHFF